MNRSLLALAIALLMTMPLYADYHYASHQGTSTYPYTSWETAADSIQKAINAASPGDTIYVGSGVWEDVPIYLRDDLALIGRGIDSTTIQKGSHTGWIHFVNAYNHTLVQDFNFNGINKRYTHDAVQGVLGSVDVKIRNNRFTNSYGSILMGENSGQIVNNLFSNCDQGINAFFDACSLLVQNNTFQNIPTEEVLIGDKGQWFVMNNIFAYSGDMRMFILVPRLPSDTFYIANNLFYRNQEAFGHLDPYVLFIPSESVFRNNTLIGPERPTTHTGIIPLYYPDSTSSVFENNSITHFYSAYHVFGPSGFSARLSYSNLWGNALDNGGSGTLELGPGIIRSDPMFEDTISFHLQAYSPLIDAGDPNILDVDGSRSDIGCYGGPGGCSYVYLDLAPKIPDSLSAFVDSSGIHIVWRNNYEADFNRYQVFRDTVTGFPPSVFNMIGEPDTSYFLDSNISPGVAYYYRFTSVDNQGNISDHSTELVVRQTGMTWDGNGNLRPEYSSIETAYPNPFNSDVTLVYSVSNIGALPAPTELKVYDIQGRVVRTLVDEKKMPGTFRVIWDGRDDAGREVSSGSYIAKLYQWGMGGGDFPIKITLVR